jgi:hypothetical protein
VDADGPLLNDGVTDGTSLARREQLARARAVIAARIAAAPHPQCLHRLTISGPPLLAACARLPAQPGDDSFWMPAARLAIGECTSSLQRQLFAAAG